MTTENLKEQVYFVLTSYVPEINKNAQHILNSGCVDLDRVEEMDASDYSLANIIAFCLAKELVNKLKPTTTVSMLEAMNISKFV